MNKFWLVGLQLAALIASSCCPALGIAQVSGPGSPGGGGGGGGGGTVWICVPVIPQPGMIDYGWAPREDGSGNPQYNTLKITMTQQSGSWDPKTGDGGPKLISINWRDTLNSSNNGSIDAGPLMYGATEVDLGVNTSGHIEVQYFWDPDYGASDTCGWGGGIDPTDPTPPDPPVMPDGPTPPVDPDGPGSCDSEATGSSPGDGGIRAMPLVRPAGPFSDFSLGQAAGGCSSCGSSVSGGGGDVPLLNLRRTFLPQNQSRNSSFGRSVFSNYDMTIQLYPDTTDAIVMMDPLTGLVLAGEDTNDDGTYEFEGPGYFNAVTLKNGSGTTVTDPSTVSPSNPLYMTITRRNGWEYSFEFVDAPVYDQEPVTPMGRLVSITSPEGLETTIAYKTFTTTELEESPRRQLQIDTVTDAAGNVAAFTYDADQQSGLWVVSQVNVNSGDYVIDYSYNSDELLMGVEINSETKATYTYGTDSTWQSATISFDEVQGEKRFKDKLHLSQDYMVWEEQLVNQYADVVLGVEDGAGESRKVVYRSPSTPGLYRVYEEGRMYEWKRGEYRKYYTSWSQSSPGFDNITGTFESTYDQHTNSTAAQLLAGEPQTVVDATGYAVDYTYDSNSNVTRKDYPDSTYELFQYDSNNQVTYHRDRAGYVTTTERDSNNHIVKIGMGLQDTSGSGTATPTSEAIMDISGYYGSGHQNEGLLQWEATVDYASGAVTAPAANERTDYEYNSLQQLVKVTKPLPGGQTNRPEVGYTYADGRVSSITDEKDEVTLLVYDDFGNVVETTYPDGTTEQKWIDGNTIYTKNRVGVVDTVYYDAAGRLSQTVKAYGHDTNLNDLAIDSTNDVNTYTVTNYTYSGEATQPIYVETNGSRTTYSHDYRGRTEWEERYPNSTTSRRTTYAYENNRLFSTFESFGSFYRRQYMGYSADGFTVRSIKTRDPSVTFANNAAVLAATRLTGSDPAHVIVDAVRDVRGNVVQMFDGLNTETRSVFDALGRETQTTRGYGLSYALTTEKEYDADSNVTSATDEAGTETVMTYDPAGNVLTKTLAYGTSIAATWTYTYTIDGKQATETMPNTGVNYNYYNSCCGRFVGSKDPLGDGKISNVDALGRVVHSAVVDDYASHTNMYDPVDAKTVGERTTLYGEDGRIAATTTWNTALGAIDPADPPIAGLSGVTASNGITTQYVFDNQLGDGIGLDSSGGITINRLGGGTGNVNIQAALTQLADTVANGGAGVSFGSTSRGTAMVMIAPDEKSMRVTISDSMGRSVLSAIMTGPAATSPNQLENWSAIAYDKTYTLTGVGVCEATWSIDQDGNYTQSIVDGIGNSVANIDQTSNLARQKFDSAGRAVVSIDRLSKTTALEYDLLGRKTKTTDPLSREVTNAYSSTTGRLTSVTDAKGHATSYTYDDLSRVLTETDRTGEVTTRTYDEMGLLATITDAESKTTAYDYDLLGRNDSTAYSDATEMTVDSFDAAGRPLVLTKPSGRQTVNSYNFNGTLAQTQYKNSTGTVTNTETFSYDNYGRKTGSSSSLYNVSLGQTYDDFGRMLTESTTYSGETYTVTYGYNGKGQRTSITYPSGDVAEYAYDDRGLLDTIDWESAEIEDRDYNANGLLTSIDRAYEDETRGYDDASQLTSISSTNTGSMTYTYDDNGNVLSETLSGVMANYSFTTEKSGAGTYSDGYDNEDRFMRYIRTGVSEDILLARSDIGTISSSTLNGSTTTNRTYNNIHAMTALGGSSQTYDTDGNATTLHTGVTVDWDDAGQVEATHVSSSATAGIEGDNEYGYLEGKKIWRKITRSSSIVSHEVYVYDGPSRIAEYVAGNSPSNPARQRVFDGTTDGMRAIIRSNGDVLIPSRNRQWSIVSLTNNANGTLLERYAYDQFGKRTIYAANGSTVRSTSNYSNDYGYTSREHLPESGVMYFRARHYDQQTGEFLSRDPLEFVDGMSLYRGYFGLVMVDPSGTEVLPQPPTDKVGEDGSGLCGVGWEFVSGPSKDPIDGRKKYPDTVIIGNQKNPRQVRYQYWETGFEKKYEYRQGNCNTPKSVTLTGTFTNEVNWSVNGSVGVSLFDTVSVEIGGSRGGSTSNSTSVQETFELPQEPCWIYKGVIVVEYLRSRSETWWLPNGKTNLPRGSSNPNDWERIKLTYSEKGYFPSLHQVLCRSACKGTCCSKKEKNDPREK